MLEGRSWQRHGLGAELLQNLVKVAEAEGLGRITGNVMSGNSGMQKVCREAGFQLHRLPDGDYRADLLMPKSVAELRKRIQ